jgi:hypothetical protein
LRALSTTLLLTIWVATSQLAQPITGAVARAAAEALGSSVKIRTAAYPEGQPELVRPPAAGERSVQIAWSSERHDGARLTLCRAASDCVERWVSFQAADPELERGRTVGFLAASVFLEEPSSSEPKPAASSPPAPTAVPRRPRALASASVVLAAPGDGTTVGARLDGSFAPRETVHVGLALQLRVGELAAAQATSRIGSALATFEYVPFRPTHAVWLGLALSAGAYQLSVSHLSEDDPEPDRKARWLFGGDAALTVGLNLGEVSSLFLAPGVEILSGYTDIYVHGVVRATWPIAIPLLRLGVRAAFLP